MKTMVKLLFVLSFPLLLNAQGYREILEIPDVPAEEKICFALYTVHENTLKMTAQLYPFMGNELRTTRLEIERDGQWITVDEADVTYPGWTSHFRVTNWDDTREYHYRVVHQDKAYYEGVIQKNPVDQEEVVVAAFTGNSVLPQHGGDIPKDDIVNNLKKIEPDLLFFSGDQVYNHSRHLASWLKFGRDFGDIIRNTPTVSIPDDHDVGHSNLWGAGGKKSEMRSGPDGGYFMPVEYVKEVEKAQTSHLPDPFDPSPVKRGIGTYYTNLNWGGISFAIIEDRKFKTGPMGLIDVEGMPRPDHIPHPNYDPEELDVPGAKLLGDRQLHFLREWAADWSNAEMKVVLSQTIFAGGAHLHGTRDNRLYADLDANGWPQTGRNKALEEIRKGFGFMLAGDQHLATIIHHGVDDWNDAGYSFCVPSIANLYLRWWDPLEEGKNRQPGQPEYLGEFEDGFDNKVTMHAVANPSPEENHDKLTTRAAGYGIVRFNKETREITMECWPRNTDITSSDENMYKDWPITIHQMDNYDRDAAAYLPTLNINKEDQVVQVIDEENNEIVYTIRINGKTFSPKVFREGSYTIYVGEGNNKEMLEGVESVSQKDAKAIEVTL